MDSTAKNVREGFWPKIRKVAAHIPFAKDAVAAFYCATDKETPTQAKAIIFGALAYFVMPVDLIPDLIPILGFTDDAAVLAAAFAMIRTHIKDRHYEAAQAWLDRN